MTLVETLNSYGSKKEPFFFCINFDLSQWEVIPLDKLPQNIFFSMHQTSKQNPLNQPHVEFIDFNSYKKQFNTIIEHIRCGNTYLTNLTASSIIQTPYNLNDIFHYSEAKYKLYFKDKFVSFSPETFVTICNNTIATYPMKGTIDSSIHNAKNIILENEKEKAEHIMIVDLLRNDLNLVSKNVRVEKFRYIDTIKAGDKELLQVSSKIVGDLDNNWHEKIGDILIPMLPAGSISGTPKKMTLDIIKQTESHIRDFFTGVWGVYDGVTLDSAVLIRFIEKNENQLIYKSGGGITIDSDVNDEYNELKNKIYFP